MADASIKGSNHERKSALKEVSLVTMSQEALKRECEEAHAWVCILDNPGSSSDDEDKHWTAEVEM